MRLLILALLPLLAIIPHVHTQGEFCETHADMYIVLTCSDTMVELPQLMMGARAGLAAWFRQTRSGQPEGPRISVCCYGTTADEQITPNGPLEADRITMVGGISRLDLGIECARMSAQVNRRPNVRQYMILIVAEDPLGFGTDDFTDASREQIRLARAEGFERVTLTTVTLNVYGDLLQDFADLGFWMNVSDFREFQRLATPGPGATQDMELWKQYCPEEPTTTTSTTSTRRPTPPPGVCDDCLIYQGIGYKHVDGECRKFIVCFFDGSDPPFVIKWTALGTFWDTPQVEQHWPKDIICAWDPCTAGGRSLTAWADERNCAGYWECADIDGLWRTFEWRCCDVNEYWDDVAKLCRPDNNDICDSVCPAFEPIPTPMACPLNARTDARFFYDTRDPGAEDMACAEGMVFDVASCTCKGLAVEEPCGPVFHLTFDGGQIVDRSRNRFWIQNVGGVTTDVDANGNWYGVFNGNSQLFVPGLSNFDLLYNWAFVVNYDGENNPNNNRVALIGSINCGRPEGPYYLALVNPRTIEGFVITHSGPTNQLDAKTQVQVSAGGMNHVVYLYRNATGLDVRVDPGGGAGHVDIDGRMWMGDNLCEFRIGFGQKWGFFNGRIYEVIVYRDPDCIPDVL